MFRWILIIAGVAILALLYFSGRPKRPAADQRQALDAAANQRAGQTASADDHYPQADNFDDLQDVEGYYADPQNGYHHHGEASVDPLLVDPNHATAPFDDISDIDPDDFVRPGSGSLPADVPEVGTHTTKSTIAQKIESISNRLSPMRGQRVASSSKKSASAPASAAGQSKIVTVHVVAPQDQVFNGATLYELFEQRGFHYGEMNIFHSMHQQKKMFSIAKMVEPGYFDINDINSFYTPGITLILQLPGPVAADVAFEVLISEARGLAQHLGGIVLGSDRSTLSNQAVSHMRENIVTYMHEQRYFVKATS